MTRDPSIARACFIPPDELPRAYGAPCAQGRIKCEPEDFQVDEILGFEPEGEGTHAWLLLRKRDANTQWLARHLARHAGVAPVDVGYAGLKDRFAVTTQWFSVRLDGRPEPDWQALESDQLSVLQVTRHPKKLKTGALQGNRFALRVRDLTGHRDAIEARVGEIRAGGVANYFGSQRFGHDGQNIDRAWELLVDGVRIRDRRLRGLYLSAARAMLFNRVLAARVRDGSWRRALAGEVLMLQGSHSVFAVEAPDADIHARLAALDVHPTGPLWGRGSSRVTDEALAIELAALEPCHEWQQGLEHAGLDQSRRPLRVAVETLETSFSEPQSMTVSFALPAGAYATMVARELLSEGSGL